MFSLFPIERPKLQNLAFRKIGQGQPRVINLTNNDGRESQMQHTKFRGNRSSGSGEDFLKGFYQIWTWQPSWSCDQNPIYNFLI